MCLGCRISFKEDQRLIIEDMTIQYKNYNLPIEDKRCIRTFLKTIVSFLNSRGGTIFLGVDDNTGEVKGNYYEQQEKQQFIIFIKSLSQIIYPRISEDIIQVEFVPIISRRFQGKYITKLIIKQGDPSRLYSFAETIILDSQNQKKQFSISYAYIRLNVGGTEQYKGLKLIQKIVSKAQQPNQTYNIFHQGCNPKPQDISLEYNLLNFVNVQPFDAQIFSQYFEQNCDKLKIDYQVRYRRDKKLLIFYFKDIQNFKKVKQFLIANVNFLNNKFEERNFSIKKQYNNNLIVQCKIKGNKQQKSNSISNSNNKSNLNKKNIIIQHINQSNNQIKPINKIENNVDNKIINKQKQKEINIAKKQQIKYIKKQQKQSKKMQELKKQNNYFAQFTFSHIQPKKSNQLQQYLLLEIPELQFDQYVNTLTVKIKDNKQKSKLFKLISQKKLSIQQKYGYKGQIKMGTNQGILRLVNINFNTVDQLKIYIRQNYINFNINFGKFQRQKNKTSLQLICRQKEKACELLDVLLKDFQLKRKFGIPGSKQRYCNVPKMKIYLELK